MKNQAVVAVTETGPIPEGAGTFEEVLRRHQSMVFSLAYYYLRDSATAEELAQDVFLQLFRDLPSIQSPAHLVFWLRRVTWHRSVDYARGRHKRREVRLDDVGEPACHAERSDPWLSRTLQRLVASLPGKARMAVILRFEEDLAYEEIAEVMDIPLNTVKSLLKRSLRLLHGKVERAMKGERP